MRGHKNGTRERFFDPASLLPARPKPARKLPFYFFTLSHARQFYSIHTRQFYLSRRDSSCMGVKRHILYCIRPDYFTLSSAG